MLGGPGDTDAEARYAFICYDCGKCFDINRGLQFHKRQQHGVFLPGRYYAVGGLCLACGVQVHARPRLIHHLNHGTTECLAQYITNRHPFHNDEVERLDAIDRANRKTLRAVGLRETHAPHPAIRLPYATSFVLPPDEDALLEARPPAGPSVLCDTPLPAVPVCFRFQKGVLPLVIIFAQGPRSVSDLQVH